MSEHLLDGVLVRGAFYLALAISAGPVLWAWLVERRRAVPLGRWRVISVLVLLAAAGVLGVVQATFAFAERWSLAGMWLVLTETTYGRVLTVHLVAALGHALAVASRPRGAGLPTVLTAAATALTLTLLGHASVQAAWHVAVQLVHAAAAIAWFGMLVVLIEQLVRHTAVLAGVLRFSRIAAALVGVLVVTGALRTVSFVIGGDEAVAWYAVLALKLACFAAALGFAAHHRQSRFHGLRDGETAAGWHRFHTHLTLEVWLVACALLLAALLSQLPPP